MLILLAIFIVFMGFYVGMASPYLYRRQKTNREEALHNQIQQAMNWSPDYFYKDKDGKYRNAKGEIDQRYTLEELMKVENEKKEIK
jgi:hypothetical protein